MTTNKSEPNDEATNKMMRVFVYTVCVCMVILTIGCVAWLLMWARW